MSLPAACSSDRAIVPQLRLKCAISRVQSEHGTRVGRRSRSFEQLGVESGAPSGGGGKRGSSADLSSLFLPTNPPGPEIVRAMTYVINQGMAMYWGTSRWSAMEIMVSDPPTSGMGGAEGTTGLRRGGGAGQRGGDVASRQGEPFRAPCLEGGCQEVGRDSGGRPPATPV